MSVNKKVAKQCLSLSSLLAPLKLRSLQPCAITWVQAIAWTAALANQPLANYHRKDCQSNAGVSPICVVTLKFVLHILNLKWVIVSDSEWIVGVCDWFERYALRVLSSDLDLLCAGALGHPVTSLWLYLHLINNALWCLTDMTRLVRCDINSASWWFYICSCRCLPLGASCFCRALGCSLLGCCGSNRWLCCGSSGCSLYSFWGRWSGDRLSSHLNLGVHVRLDSIWVMFTNVLSCSSKLSSTNDFDDVGNMIGCMYYSGREPWCPVIVDYRNRLSCIEWGFLVATCIVMVSCTLSCTFL